MTTCQGSLTRPLPGPYGFLAQPCRTERGLRRWFSADGREHAACSRHFAAVQRRFPPTDPLEPRWLHDDVPHECPTCLRPFEARVTFPEQGWERFRDAADYLEGVPV